MKVSSSVSGAVRQFSYWFAKESLGNSLLKNINYVQYIGEKPSMVEQVYAIIMNNLILDKQGYVLNFKETENRAAQYIRCYFDSDYTVELYSYRKD